MTGPGGHRLPAISGTFDGRRLVPGTEARVEHGTFVLLDADEQFDSEGLLEGFRLRGEAILDELGGRFAVAVWDEESRAGLVAVDRLASRPLFFHTAGSNRVEFAAELADLLARLAATPGPDVGTVARWLSHGSLDRGETLYAGIRRLPAGHCLSFRDGRWLLRRYWRPRFRQPLLVTRPEAVEALREEVARAVTERSTGRRAGIMLSGGIDSSSIAAVARAAGGTSSLGAYSAVFPDHPEADEAALIEEIARELDLQSHRLDVGRRSVLQESEEYVRRWRVPPPSPTLFFQLPLRRAAAEAGTTLLLDGEGGDELFGCVPYLLADELRRLHVRSLLRLAASLPGVGPTPEPRVIRRTVRLYALPAAVPHRLLRVAGASRRRAPQSSFLRPEVARLVTGNDPRWAWTQLDGPRWWAALADRLTAGRERMLVHEHLRRVSATVGVPGAHPYLDDLRLIELVLRLPPELSFDPIHDRPLLRAAMRGLLPENVRLREDKSYFDRPFVDAFQEVDGDAVAALLGADARIRAFVRPAAVDDVVAATRRRSLAPAAALRAWRLASTEQWLRQLES